jgi:hypothetical protein
MSFYHWAMGRAATILFFVSLLIFVVTFASRFFFFGSALETALNQSGMGPVKMNIFANVFGALAEAASASVWSFLGAALLYRIDRHWVGREDPRA